MWSVVPGDLRPLVRVENCLSLPDFWALTGSGTVVFTCTDGAIMHLAKVSAAFALSVDPDTFVSLPSSGLTGEIHTYAGS